MSLQIAFALKKVFNYTDMLVYFMWVHFGSEFLNLLRVKQEEVTYALSVKHFHWLKEIIVFKSDVLPKYIIKICGVHV